MTWWQLTDDTGVLELDRPALELHWQRRGGRTVAWWCDAWGRWLGRAVVGLA